jgi:hypothetical protein
VLPYLPSTRVTHITCVVIGGFVTKSVGAHVEVFDV